ncbi:MAG TPA: phage minor head protein [Candidatus Sulfotelmatobacter sp.]|nr:phage minor head protein [Candidatus Sulfotelmatobacter sp.]
MTADDLGTLDAAVELAGAALELVDAIETKPRALDHPDHQRLIRPLVKRTRRLLATYFRKQGAAILDEIKPWLKLHMGESSLIQVSRETIQTTVANGGNSRDIVKALREAGDDAAKSKALDILPDSVVPLAYPITREESTSYRELIAEAIRRAESQFESELKSGARIGHSAMADYLNDNSLSKLTGDFSETTKERLRNAIAEAVEEGGTADEIVQAIQDEVDQFSSVRANMIAQTEVNDAYNFGRDALAREAGLDEKAWITESGNPCIECLGNQLQGYIPIDEPFQSGSMTPTEHPNCCLGDALVSPSGRILSAFRRWYEGEVVILRVAGSADLAVTPNHPIFTRDGWIEAGSLMKGDQVLQCVWPSDTSSVGRPNNNYAESAIADIFDSLRLSGESATTRMPVTAEAFHGDATVDQEVDIIWSTRSFTDDISQRTDHVRDGLLSNRHRQWAAFSSLSAPYSFLGGSLDAAHSSVSRSGIKTPLFGREFGVADKLSGTATALLESEDSPMIRDRFAGYTNTFGDGKDRFSSEMRLVEIIETDRRQFAGHVYNLETEYGWYSANSIVVHNCQCGLDYRVVSTGAKP